MGYAQALSFVFRHRDVILRGIDATLVHAAGTIIGGLTIGTLVRRVPIPKGKWLVAVAGVCIRHDDDGRLAKFIGRWAGCRRFTGDTTNRIIEAVVATGSKRQVSRPALASRSPLHAGR